jgi:predicted PurR-regulated permease PerM
VALPVVLACMVALTLMPLVRRLQRRGVPPGLTAVVVVVGLAAGLSIGAYALSGAASHWLQEAPSIGQHVETKLRAFRGSVEALSTVEKQVDSISGSPNDPTTQEVVVKEPGFLAGATSTLWSGVTTLVLSLLLLFFLLASGDMVYEKILRVLPTLYDKKAALRIVHDMEASISHYLLTVTMVNIGLGIAIGTAMWLLGMPNPALWGVVATILNFLPYIGAITGIVMTGLVALVTFDTVQHALLVPLIYFTLTSLEGNVITPIIVGRRLELNTVAIFVGLAFWGWVWGIAGVLIAVPLLVIVKRICDHLPSWAALGEFLAPSTSQLKNGNGNGNDA